MTFSIVPIPSITHADDNCLYNSGDKDGSQGDRTNQLFITDGSLRDPNTVVKAKETAVNSSFYIPSTPVGISINISTDRVQPTSSTGDETTNLKASYNLPLKWNRDTSSQQPLYYDVLEGKNGVLCNHISIYSALSPKQLDIATLEQVYQESVLQNPSSWTSSLIHTLIKEYQTHT